MLSSSSVQFSSKRISCNQVNNIASNCKQKATVASNQNCIGDREKKKKNLGRNQAQLGSWVLMKSACCGLPSVVTVQRTTLELNHYLSDNSSGIGPDLISTKEVHKTWRKHPNSSHWLWYSANVWSPRSMWPAYCHLCSWALSYGNVYLVALLNYHLNIWLQPQTWTHVLWVTSLTL